MRVGAAASITAFAEIIIITVAGYYVKVIALSLLFSVALIWLIARE
jgi:hypothetical protein